jgi:acyl-CoA hydrolase
LKKGLDASESDEKKRLKELSQHEVELEKYQYDLEQAIAKLENLTELSPPADLILYRKRNPDMTKQLQSPGKVVVTDPAFTAGQKNQNEIQFGKMNKCQLTHVKADDETQYTQVRKRAPITQTLPVKSVDKKDTDKIQMALKTNLEELEMLGERNLKSKEELDEKSKHKAKRKVGDKLKASANSPLLPKSVLQQPVKLSEIKPDRKELRHVACLCDGRAYISGSGSGTLLIDRSSSHQDTISTSGEPCGLGVMKDGSLIYAVHDDGAIYRAFLDRQSRILLNKTERLIALCCTRSGEILTCLYSAVVLYGRSSAAVTVTMARYTSNGEEIQQFQLRKYDTTGLSMEKGWSICENVNGDICTSCPFSSEVKVCDKSGNMRFCYDVRCKSRTFGYGWQGRSRMFGVTNHFQPRCLATDSLGHILISDNKDRVVHIISQDGDFIAHLLTQSDGITCPRGIAVDQSNNLWLVDREGVKVYQYLS